jgi:hypothetical protein
MFSVEALMQSKHEINSKPVVFWTFEGKYCSTQEAFVLGRELEDSLCQCSSAHSEKP